MTIVRYAPGAKAPHGAQYLLVGHYGEFARVAVWCAAGETLPSVTDLDGELVTPVWFVELATSAEELAAA